MFVASSIKSTNFNPRLREGGDEYSRGGDWDTSDFNPRLREGGDSGVSMAYCSSMISIHASEKEATANREHGQR